MQFTSIRDIVEQNSGETLQEHELSQFDLVLEKAGLDEYFVDLEKAIEANPLHKDELLEKGRKDLSKLVQKTVTDKRGHQRKVWVKAGEDPSKSKQKKSKDPDSQQKKSTESDKAPKRSISEEEAKEAVSRTAIKDSDGGDKKSQSQETGGDKSGRSSDERTASDPPTFTTDPNEIKSFCDEMGISDYKIDSKGRIAVQGHVKLTNFEGSSLPVAFRSVSGSFSLTNCPNLTTIKGSPKEVGGSFTCEGNPKLKSLKGGPKEVALEYFCRNNALTSLEGAPDEVEGDFICTGNNLTSLKGAPSSVGEIFDCGKNKLTSLEGGPVDVYSYFCHDNQIASLRGAPAVISGDFDCSGNKLMDLKGAPDEIGETFNVSRNPILDDMTDDDLAEIIEAGDIVTDEEGDDE